MVASLIPPGDVPADRGTPARRAGDARVNMRRKESGIIERILSGVRFSGARVSGMSTVMAVPPGFGGVLGRLEMV